ncbi:MAG: IclR family transcriptional regulator domain-containing protein [Candidatus Binataceae bacterium]
MSNENRDSVLVQSLARGLSVIRTFGRDAQRQTLSEVAERAGLSRATARRFLHTLAELGYARFDGRHFALTPRVLDLGYAYLSSTSLWEVAQPHMETVTAKLHESCSVSVLEEPDIVYVARVPTKRIMTVTLGVGIHLPAYATSMGRVLLAHLPALELEKYFAIARLDRLTDRTVTDPEKLRAILKEVAQRGWAMVDQELELGVRSVAAPIRDGSGHVIAAMNASGHASRVTVAQMKRHFVPVLLDAVQNVSAALSLRRP